MPKNIDEINRQVDELLDDTANIPARDNNGDLAFPLSVLWDRLIAKLGQSFITAGNILTGSADSDGKYQSNSTIAAALETKATKDALNQHKADNYVTGDPHLIISNRAAFRNSIDVYSKAETDANINAVKTIIFKGYFGTTDPQTIAEYVLAVGDYWYNGTDFMTLVPQNDVNVSMWNGSAWVTQQDDGTGTGTLVDILYPNGVDIHFDAWNDTATNDDYYWLNGWERIDLEADGVTIGTNTAGKLEVKDGAITMPKLADDVISNQTIQEQDLSSQVDGTNTTFTTNFDLTQLSVEVYHNGIKQRLNIDYTIAGSNIVFNTAPALGDSVVAILQGFLPTVETANVLYNIVPDYSNIETINRITANNGTWTADRDGYVALRANFNNSGNAQFYINNILANSEGLLGTYPDWFGGVIARVSTGDIVRIIGTSITSVSCRFIPQKIISYNNLSYQPVNQLLTMGPPDYSRIETINRISTSGGSWTADRNGYVRCVAGSSPSANLDVIVNGIHAFSLFTGGNGNATTIIPISIGDIVTIIGNVGAGTPIICYFIPPIINPPQYLEQMPVLDYSTAEQDTGKKDINGKSVFQKTIQWTSVSLPSGQSFVVGTIASIAPGMTQIINSAIFSNTSKFTLTGGFTTTSNNLTFMNQSSVQYGAGETITATLWYIK